jgi:hypothetical protein
MKLADSHEALLPVMGLKQAELVATSWSGA